MSDWAPITSLVMLIGGGTVWGMTKGTRAKVGLIVALVGLMWFIVGLILTAGSL